MCGPNLNWEGLANALECFNTDNFETVTKSFMLEPFDPANPLYRLGAKQVFLQQCIANGESKKLTDWMAVEY